MDILILHCDHDKENYPTKVLSSLGYKIKTVSCTLDAKLWLHVHQASLVIAPLKASNEDVFELLCWVRQNEAISQTPFVLLCTTILPTETVIKTALALHATDLIIQDGWHRARFLNALQWHLRNLKSKIVNDPADDRTLRHSVSKPLWTLGVSPDLAAEIHTVA